MASTPKKGLTNFAALTLEQKMVWSEPIKKDLLGDDLFDRVFDDVFREIFGEPQIKSPQVTDK